MSPTRTGRAELFLRQLFERRRIRMIESFVMTPTWRGSSCIRPFKYYPSQEERHRGNLEVWEVFRLNLRKALTDDKMKFIWGHISRDLPFIPSRRQNSHSFGAMNFS